MNKIAAWLSRTLDVLSEYLAERKGLLPLVGVLMVILNLIIVAIFPGIWISRTNLFLHLGITVAVLGVVLARAL